MANFAPRPCLGFAVKMDISGRVTEQLQISIAIFSEQIVHLDALGHGRGAA